MSCRIVDRGKWTSSYIMKVCGICPGTCEEAGIRMLSDGKHLKPKLKHLCYVMMPNTIITSSVVLLCVFRVIITPSGTCANSRGFHMLSFHIVDFCVKMALRGGTFHLTLKSGNSKSAQSKELSA